MNRLAIAALLLFIVFSQKLTAQSDSLIYDVISGKIIDDSLAYPLPHVHIWNESTRMGTVSNDSGEFRLTVSDQDTIVFSILGYASKIMVASSGLGPVVQVRLKQKKYEISEVVVRRFRNYESFKYQVLHLDLPEPEAAQSRSSIQVSSITAALDADRKRAEKDILESGRFGYTTPLGKGIDREKAFKEKIHALEKRKRVIHAKFNRELVGEITKLEGDELTEFIALCNFSEDYLYETDLYTITEAMYTILDEFRNMKDSISSVN